MLVVLLGQGFTPYYTIPTDWWRTLFKPWHMEYAPPIQTWNNITILHMHLKIFILLQ